MEVDASEIGLRAVLSQRHGKPGKLYPCAFFSRNLTPAEVNYDIGNRELLAVKAAIKEWYHWLDGVLHPFTILTDHRNLEYIWQTKCLNPRQVRWALFFTCFHFTISYHPGLKNADVLSRRYSPPEQQLTPEPIILSSMVVALVSWDVEGKLAPQGCPTGRLYIPRMLQTRVIEWARTSPASGHPGVSCTSSVLSRKILVA